MGAITRMFYDDDNDDDVEFFLLKEWLRRVYCIPVLCPSVNKGVRQFKPFTSKQHLSFFFFSSTLLIIG